MTKIATLVAAMLAVALVARPARGTVYVRLPLAQLVEAADTVAVGRVVAVADRCIRGRNERVI